MGEIHKATGVKKLSNPIVLFILINSILGSSLFYLPGLGVKSSGAASIIAWVAIFAIAAFIMLYISELITLHPSSGGTYEFCKRAYGRFISFLAGWTIWIAGNLGMALALIASAEYFIPETTNTAFLLRILFVGIWIIVLNFMAFRGIDAGVTMLVTFGIIATIVVVLMTVPSFIDIPALFSGKFAIPFQISFLEPFFQHEGYSAFSYLSLSIFLIVEAFFGFEVISYMGNELKNPKQIHKTLIKSIIFCGVITTIYILSSLGTVSYHDYVNDARPFAVQAFNTMGNFGELIVRFGMYLVILGTAAAWPITGSRLIRAMAEDKLFLRHFAVLHEKYKSPYRAVIFQTIAVLFFSWILFRGYWVGWQDSYRTSYLIYVILSLLVLNLIIFAVPVLRRKESTLKRSFKAPFARVGPILILIFVLFLIINWINLEGGTAWSILRLAGSFLLLGIPIYFMVEMFYDARAIIKVNEVLSYLSLAGEKIFFPISIRAKLLKDMGEMKGKTILEYGCSVGALTKRLAPKLLPGGRIFATDLSLRRVKIVSKRTKKHNHVSVHHHPHLHDFKLKLPKKVDGVISVGMLSYMQKPQKVLASLAKRVKKGGEIIFVDYDKFFYIIPNVAWISDTVKLKGMFRKAGFDVVIEKKKSLLWQHIIISGRKV
jgi:basic amino acid/polyamine antiporter, APA family